MSNVSSAGGLRRPGLVAGILLAIIGVAAAWLALGFDDDSRPFPLGLATLLALVGLAIAAKAVVDSGESSRRPRGQGAVAVAVGLLSTWGLAFTLGAGFLLPTFGLMAGLLYICGVRRPATLLLLAVAISVAAWILFVALLDIPLPPSLLPDAMQSL